MKSLLDSSQLQRTIGSVPTQASATGTSFLVQYSNNTIIAQPSKPVQSLITLPQTVAVTQALSQVNVPKTTSKTIPQSSSAKVIDLTVDDDSAKARLLNIPATVAISNQNIRHVLAQQVSGTQLVRPAIAGQGSYQLLINGPAPAIRALGTGATTTLVQSALPLQASNQSILALNPSVTLTPGTSLARAAVPINPVTQVLQQVPAKVRILTINNDMNLFRV